MQEPFKSLFSTAALRTIALRAGILFLAGTAVFGQGSAKSGAPAKSPEATLSALLGSDPKAKKVIDDALAALGGDKFLKMEDRTETGRAYSFYNDRLTGLSIARIYTRYITVPEGRSGKDLGIRERQSFGKAEDTAVVFRETEGANVNWRGAQQMPPENFDRYRESTLRNIFYLLRQRLDEPGLVFESRGAAVVDYAPVDGVDIIDSENRRVTVYFHQQTHLPVKQEYSWLDPKSKERNDEVTRYTRYRETNGVQWPQQITRERNGEKIYQMFSEAVTFNQDLTDNLFETTPLNPKGNSKKK
jgi:hypothetical protein